MATPSADYQASVSGLLLGAGTPYKFGPNGIQGLGNPRVKTGDVVLHGREGSVGSPDYRDVRPIIFDLVIAPASDDPGEAFDALTLLKAAWLPVSADIECHIRLPGLGHYFWMGRPRELDEDLRLLYHGVITVIATFIALDPQGTAV